MRKRLPPYGRQLAERLDRGDPPFLVVACGDGYRGWTCWDEAKLWASSPNGNAGIVYPGDRSPHWYRWPVTDCLCIVSQGRGPDDRVIDALTTELLRVGALSVAVFDFRYGITRAVYPAGRFHVAA
jgi:hypothetical protein